jgi:hypothetical protein
VTLMLVSRFIAILIGTDATPQDPPIRFNMRSPCKDASTRGIAKWPLHIV